METPLSWQADADLVALLRRYYQGEAALWDAIQAAVHAELLARGIQIVPRHLRFRPSADGYTVVVEDAEAYRTGA
jgi:hypothetical protein